jgi:hypothetical protein
MAKPITTAYTNYPSGESVRRVALLRYDGNKYTSVRFEDGSEDEIKRGYLFRNPELTRAIPDIQWHLLNGGTRRNYKRRMRKTQFTVFPMDRSLAPASGLDDPKFDTQARAVAYAIRLAKESGHVYEVYAAVNTRNSFFGGQRIIECRPNGDAAVHHTNLRHRAPKYLRGYGKHPSRH